MEGIVLDQIAITAAQLI